MSDFIIQQNTDGQINWPVSVADGSDFDPDGWSARMQVRSHSGNILAEFSTAGENLSFTEDGLQLVWTSAETLAWTWTGGRFDLILVSEGQVIRADAGYIIVSEAITR